MRAALFTAYNEPFEIEEVNDPTLDSSGVIVETEACGICRSDWHAWRGDWEWRGVTPEPGHILGHEPAGTVIEVGDEVKHVRVGDHVTIPFNIGDGTCSLCRNGYSNICRNRLGLGFDEDVPGAFAEQIHVPFADHNVVRLPSGVSSLDMAGLGCRFMTAFHALVHRANVSAGDWLAVHGCGGVGLSAVQIADALGANVIAVDLMDEKLEIAKKFGAVESVNASKTDNVPDEVRRLTGDGADISVDALGIRETCQNSVLSLDKRGQHVQIGMTTDEEEGMISLPTDLIALRELKVIGSVGMPPPRYDEIFRMVATKKLDPGAIVSETVSLKDISEKLASMNDYGTIGIPVITEF